MAIAIYADVQSGRHHYADSTSKSTLDNLATGRWVLFDATPDTPPPPGDPFDEAVADRIDDSASETAKRLRAASGAVAATVTASGALVVQKHNPVDASAAARTMTLPTGQVEGTTLSVEKVDASANLVSITGDIRDVAAQTITLAWSHETITFRADATGSWWPISGHKTKASLDAAFDARYQQARRPRVALLGDSITNQNGDIADPSTRWTSARGFFAWANTLLRGRFDQVYASTTDDEFGDSSLTAATLVSNGNADSAAASDADIVVVHAGTNDIGNSVAPATIAASLLTIWKKQTAVGKTVVATTILPRNNGETATSTLIQNLRDTNRLIRANARATRGVVLCDWYSAMVDPATSMANAAYLSDGIHPNAVGAGRMGAALAAVLDRLSPPGADDLALDNADTVDRLSNGLFTGTTGTVTGPATGTMATGWSITADGTVTSVVASKVARTDLGAGEWQQVVCTAAGNNGFHLQAQNTAVGVDWAVGDRVYAAIEFETDAAGWDGRSLSANVDFFGNGSSAIGMRHTSSEVTALTLPLWRPPSGVIITPVATIPTSTTRLQLNVNFRGAGTVRFGRAQIVKV